MDSHSRRKLRRARERGEGASPQDLERLRAERALHEATREERRLAREADRAAREEAEDDARGVADVAWFQELRRREASFLAATAAHPDLPAVCSDCGGLVHLGIVIAAGEVQVHDGEAAAVTYKLTFRIPAAPEPIIAHYYGAAGTPAYNQIADALVPEADERAVALDDDDLLGRWCIVRVVPRSDGFYDMFEVRELARALA